MTKFLSRLWTFVIFVAVVAAGYGVVTLTPSTEEREHGFSKTGELGSIVEAREFQGSVVGLRGAASMKDKGYKHDTQGVWVIVRVRINAREKPISLLYAALEDAEGRRYASSQRIDQPMLGGSRRFQPGVPIEGEVAFEVPKDVVSGLSVRLAANGVLFTAMDDIVVVPLPISNVNAWLADETPAGLAKPEVSS